jgi:hypothetical protein
MMPTASSDGSPSFPLTSGFQQLGQRWRDLKSIAMPRGIPTSRYKRLQRAQVGMYHTF